MTFPSIVPILFMITLLGGLIFALINRKAVVDRLDDPSAPKSTLAKDGPQGGVALLLPLAQQTRQQPRAAKPVID